MPRYLYVCALLSQVLARPFPFQSTFRGSSIRELNPYPTKPKLTFKADGSFKLLVFSDLHFGENPWDDWGPQQDVNSSALMRRVLADEAPDYAVINGDLITGENTFKENATSLINEIVAPLNEALVPFSSTHGNHDNQANITHSEEILREQAVAPLSYTRFAPPGVGGPEGPGNYWVPVYRSSTDTRPALILWFFDSRGGFTENPNSEPVPDWVDASVGDWLISEIKQMDRIWGPSDQRASLAFVHIPPHAIQNVQSTLNPVTNPGLNADTLGGGSVQASVDANDVGKDQPFWNVLTSKVKNLRAIISGHDHGNEWCAREPTKDVIFCFDKHSGYGGYGQPDWGYGIRNIVFPPQDPRRPFDPQVPIDTWIRLEEGDTRAKVTLDASFGRA